MSHPHCCHMSKIQFTPQAFQLTVTDRSALPVSKKWGALNVINGLFKIYFSINNLRLCQNLIRAVEGPAFPKATPEQKNIRDHIRTPPPPPPPPQRAVEGPAFPKARPHTHSSRPHTHTHTHGMCPVFAQCSPSVRPCSRAHMERETHFVCRHLTGFCRICTKR